MQRIQISIDENALNRIDQFVESAGLSRSAFLVMAALDYIKAKELMPKYSTAILSMAQIFDNSLKGNITKDEAKQRMSDISNLLAIAPSEE